MDVNLSGRKQTENLYNQIGTYQTTIWRWREAYQYDFAARMDWCIAKQYEDANHNPIAVLNGNRSKEIVEILVKSGKQVTLSAEGSNDPDGDEFEIRWFVYPEAGTYQGEIELRDHTSSSTSFRAPTIKEKSTVHVILQLRDKGNPSLYSYRRAILSIEPNI